MAKKVAKTSMPTCTVPTQIEKMGHKASRKDSAFTLTEVIVVILIIALFALLAVINLSGPLTKNTFKAQAQRLVSAMQMAVNAAAQSDKRYEVIIDLIEQTYMIREITQPDLLADVLEEEIIVENELGNNCQVVYVLFDDLVDTDEEHQIAKFRAGRTGWQNGGKIILLDENGQEYSVVVNRISRIVTLKEGNVELLMPKASYEMQF